MDKIAYEKIIVGHMIDLYCRKKHKGEGLCVDCEQLKQYALERLAKCPFGTDKTACKDCKVHCYKNDMRDKIRQVMRFSGPRMFFYYPKDAFLHFKKRDPEKLISRSLFYSVELVLILEPIFSLPTQ